MLSKNDLRHKFFCIKWTKSSGHQPTPLHYLHLFSSGSDVQTNRIPVEPVDNEEEAQADEEDEEDEEDDECE